MTLTVRRGAIIAILTLGALAGRPLRAQTLSRPDSAASDPATGSAAWVPQVLGTQVNVIAQHLWPFHSPYAGPSSLVASGDRGISHTYGVYLGAEPFGWGAAGARRTRIEAYLDVEMARGHGVSRASGLAGVTNGDVLRAGSADLGNGPYVARAFLRMVHPIGSARDADTLERDIDELPTVVATRRVELSAGKLALSDLFDLNRYANSTRTQFLNWGLFQNTAWDFAADTRGYTNGVAVAWITSLWTLRAGSFQMPRRANGNKFDADLEHARGDNAELTLTPGGNASGNASSNASSTHAPTVRLLGFVNHARMGSYAEALARARALGTTPAIVADDRPGRRKYGWGVNIEQPLADSGETGAFLRAGWNDGANESFVFTEADRHLSGGIQVSGAHWRRPADRVGAAIVQHGIVTVHREYLAAGGIGFLLGDGRLTYGPERIGELYYRAQAGRYVQVSPDVQVIENPGYNRDRGPAAVAGVRVNVRY